MKLNKQKDWVIFLLHNPCRALKIEANIGTAAASKIAYLIAANAPDILKIGHQEKVYIWVNFIIEL